MFIQATSTENVQAPDLRRYDIKSAILSTIAYSDVFDYPVTVKELCRYLIAYPTSESSLQEVLKNGGLFPRTLSTDGEYLALAGREEIFALRRKRAMGAATLWPRSLRYGKLIAQLPFIRMVAVTGALASDNVDLGADLDYLIVTAPGWLWLCRAMILALDRMAVGVSLCPNFLLTENSLVLQDRDLFAAQEMTRMVPISGFHVYLKMRAKNGWTDSFLPNAYGAPRNFGEPAPLSRSLQKFGEALLNNPAIRHVEGWEMRRKIGKFSWREKLTAEARFSADYCKGHFDGHKQKTMQAFHGRIENLGLSGQ